MDQADTVVSSSKGQSGPLDVFVSVAPSDEPYLDELATSLALITTVRTDYVARFGALPALEALLNTDATRYHLRAITPEGLRAAVLQPATRAGLEWESDLPDRILEDAAASKGSLPLVAHVLWALWSRRRGRRLMHEAYRELGGVGGALATSADALLESLGDDGRARAKRLLVRLVRVGQGGEEDARRAALRSEALAEAGGDAEAERVLLRLSGFRDPDRPDDASSSPPRLVVVVEEGGGEAQVALVHDALLVKWPVLRGLLDEKRKALACRDDLEAAARGWRAAGSPQDGLPGGAQLAYFRKAEGASAEGRRFLEAATARGRARARRFRWMIAGLTAGLIAFAGVAVFAMVQQGRAERDRALAERRLSQAVEVADTITFVIDRKLEHVAGAAGVRRELLEGASKLQESLLEGASESAKALRSRMVSHNRRGDLAVTHDDLARARAEYDAGLAIARRLAERDPRSDIAQQDLWVSYSKLGEVAQASGDVVGARGFFEKDLELTKALSEADPQNAGLKRDLSESYNMLGEVAQASGDVVGARGFFEKDLELTKALSEADPQNAGLQVDLVVSHLNLADLTHRTADRAAARAHRAQAAAVLDRLEQSGRAQGNAMIPKLRDALAAIPPDR